MSSSSMASRFSQYRGKRVAVRISAANHLFRIRKASRAPSSSEHSRSSVLSAAAQIAWATSGPPVRSQIILGCFGGKNPESMNRY